MSSPQVGGVLTTVEQLDSCPEGTIVRSVHGMTVEKGTRHRGEWFRYGHTASYDAGELFRTFDDRWEVVWVPPVTRAEVTTDMWAIDSSHVFFPHTPELVDLLRSVLVGERVRVTVEKIGNDDE